jgi:hypothetical protein
MLFWAVFVLTLIHVLGSSAFGCLVKSMNPFSEQYFKMYKIKYKSMLLRPSYQTP